MCLPHNPTRSHLLAVTVPPGNPGCLISSCALTSTGSCQQELVKKPKPTTFILFSTTALEISSCGQQADNKAPLHVTSDDSPVPPRLGTTPARQGGGLQPGPLCGSAMVFLPQYVCLPTSELGTSLGSPVPGSWGRGCLAQSHAANLAKGSKLCTSSKIQHPSPCSSQPAKATHGNQSVPSAPAPEHPHHVPPRGVPASPGAGTQHKPILSHGPLEKSQLQIPVPALWL